MNKYQEGKIYKLVNNDLIYIGSTIRTLYDRFKEHKIRSKGTLKHCRCSSKLLFDNNDNVSIELIELYPCYSKKELCLREAYWIKEIKCINKKLPFTTDEDKRKKRKQYEEDNKEVMRIYKKEYIINHRNEKKEYDKLYRDNNKAICLKMNECECGGSYKTKHKTTHFKTKKHMDFMLKIKQ